MKTIRQNLTVGKANQGLDMYACLSLDGKQIRRFKCDSMVGNFARYLFGQFHGGHAIRPSVGTTSTSYEEITGLIFDEVIGTVRIRTSWGSYFGNYWSNTGDDFIYIYGMTGDLEYLNGYYRVERHTDIWGRLYHMDGSPVLLGDDDIWNGSGYQRRVHYQLSSRHANDVNYFMSWWPIVGSDNTPVNVSDIWLRNMIRHGSSPGELNHGNRDVSALATDKPSSRFVVTRSFTNQTDADITVREIGLAGDYSASNTPARTKILLARDTMDEGIIVPPNKTLTVDYEVIIELTPDTQNTDVDGTNGGFLQNFMSRMRSIANLDDWNMEHVYNMAAPGGTASANAHGNYRGCDYGIQVGSDNTFVSMTDQNLLGLIAHGAEQGELWYHGMDFDDLVIDELANKATFTMSRLFQNKSGSPIVIKEIGLRGNWSFNTSFITNRQYARTAFHPDDQITVQPDEFVMVEYQVEVIV
jgi:hypothetical protein